MCESRIGVAVENIPPGYVLPNNGSKNHKYTLIHTNPHKIFKKFVTIIGYFTYRI